MENYYFKHPSHFGEMFGIFEDFFRSRTLSDVIIACNGKNIHAHCMVLCAGSDYFRKLLTTIKTPNQLPVLIINDIPYNDMETILEFIYRGQIVVSREKVESLRQAAYKLQVKGFENFLRKPFVANGSLSFNSMMARISNGSNGNVKGSMSLLSDNKRCLPNVNEMDMKKFKSSHYTQTQNGHNNSHAKNFESQHYNGNQYYPNPYNHQSIKNTNKNNNRQHPYSDFRPNSDNCPHLQAALQRGVINNNHSNPTIPNGIPQNYKNAIMEQYKKNSIYDSNGTLDLKVDISKNIDQIPITPVNGVETGNDHNTSLNDSYDENEDNQRNESAENAMEKMKSNERNYYENDGKNNNQAFENGNGNNNPSVINHTNGTSILNHSNTNVDDDINAKEYDSDDSQGVNYTYELDPNAFVDNGQWENGSENSPSKDDVEAMEEEDYFESLIRQSALLQEKLTKTENKNQTKNNFFYCEHCPKYFFDEDHLQLHIKRSHGLNKLNRCDICGKTYAWKSGLYKHKRHVHNIGGNGKSMEDGGVSPELLINNNNNNSQPSTPKSSNLEVLKDQTNPIEQSSSPLALSL